MCDPRPSLSDLSDRIKMLQAAHTSEATPERVGRRRPAAEEPVTAKIRRRLRVALAFNPASCPTRALRGRRNPLRRQPRACL